MDHKKLFFGIILVVIIFIILIKTYILYPEITSFRPTNEKMEQDYAISINTEESFTASSRLFFNDFISLSEEGDQLYITFAPNNNRVYSYEIVGGELIFVKLVDENGELICSKDCDGIYKLDQFLARCEVIQQLNKYY